MSQKSLGRRHARPVAAPVAGVVLARSTPDLGWQKVRIKGTVDVETSLLPDTKKKKVYWGFQRFVQWMEKEGHKYVGGLEIHGPYPHMDWKEPDVQYGDRGSKRLVGRDIRQDLGNNGKEDYVISGHFLVRERIQEIRSDVDVIGTRGIRAL